MKNLVWFPGAPPHVGWWLTKYQGSEYESWRWWGGHEWSIGFGENTPSGVVSRDVDHEAIAQEPVRWSTYYPENPRVPRLDPTGLTQCEIARFYIMATCGQSIINEGGSTRTTSSTPCVLEPSADSHFKERS